MIAASKGRPGVVDVAVIVAVCIAAALVAAEGVRSASLSAQIPLAPKELYARLAQKNARVQIVDARALDAYAESHVPGALPFPGCDGAATPEAARARILPSVPTVIVLDAATTTTMATATATTATTATTTTATTATTTKAGTQGDVAARCRGAFTSAVLLAGGFEAWDDANLPEDSGDYVAPKAAAGGGCL